MQKRNETLSDGRVTSTQSKWFSLGLENNIALGILTKISLSSNFYVALVHRMHPSHDNKQCDGEILKEPWQVEKGRLAIRRLEMCPWDTDAPAIAKFA